MAGLGRVLPVNRKTRLARWIRGTVIGSSTILTGSILFSRPFSPPTTEQRIHEIPTIHLLRSYLVYSACSVPWLVDRAPTILDIARSVPVLRSITNVVLRHTFFAQFVGGESVEDCAPVVRDLRNQGVGVMLNYAAEVGGEEELGEELEQKRMRELERAIDGAEAFESEIEASGGERGGVMVSLKITGMTDPDVLQRATYSLLRLRASDKAVKGIPYPGAPSETELGLLVDPAQLNRLLVPSEPVSQQGVLAGDQGLRKEDLLVLQRLWRNLDSLVDRAKRKRIKLLIDAEHSWYQPAIDALTLCLAEKYNRAGHELGQSGPSVIIHGTYQCYLVRQPAYLAHMLAYAKRKGFDLGIKLVRGAYMAQEREKWQLESRPGDGPIWPEKSSTDETYNNSVRVILETLSEQLKRSDGQSGLSVVFGTHNLQSVQSILDQLVDAGLAESLRDEAAGSVHLKANARGHVHVGQLYGMKDDLTDMVTSAIDSEGAPVAVKCIAYGQLSDVIAFLGRRAVENKSVMSGTSGASAERRRIGKELLRRVGMS